MLTCGSLFFTVLRVINQGGADLLKKRARKRTLVHQGTGSVKWFSGRNPSGYHRKWKIASVRYIVINQGAASSNCFPLHRRKLKPRELNATSLEAQSLLVAILGQHFWFLAQCLICFPLFILAYSDSIKGTGPTISCSLDIFLIWVFSHETYISILVSSERWTGIRVLVSEEEIILSWNTARLRKSCWVWRKFTHPLQMLWKEEKIILVFAVLASKYWATSHWIISYAPVCK